MHNAMKTASASSTHRVWQTLPRHLRRRAASHDIRRVPLRLREKATAEMDPVKTQAPTRSKSKAGKYRQKVRTDALLRRQRDKKWLETHLWHAKRMHMENMWGYRLAVSPTDKTYRPSHRASMHDAIIHDASYYSCIEIKGSEKLIVEMLESFCDPQGSGPGSKRYLSGARMIETHAYKRNAYPYELVAPLALIWRPQSQLLNYENGKGKKNAGTPLPSKSSDIRSILLRFHPLAHATMLDILKESASYVLETYKRSHQGRQETRLEITDVTGHFNVFEIMGPKSSQVLHGCLSPVHSVGRTDFSQFWASFANLQSAGSAPRSMVIGFQVLDPRLKFPPRNARIQIDAASYVHAPPIAFPSSQLAHSEIWNEQIRKGLLEPRFKKKDLDQRKSINLIPGTSLDALRQDDRIPVVLIQRSLENSGTTDAQSVHGWTLIVPAGWGMPFFSSLIFTSTRIAGQSERQTQSYESGKVYFPRDYPTTDAYSLYASEQAMQEKAVWDRKPPAKRVNYCKLGSENPFKPDWESILGIANKAEDQKVITTQREVPTPSDTRPFGSTVVRPWLLRGPEVPKIISSMSSVFNQGAILHSEVNRLRLKRGLAPLSNSVKPGDLLQNALINVQFTTCLRGSPQDHALVYILDDDVCLKWNKFIHQLSTVLDVNAETTEEHKLAGRIPDNTAIIGSITTGHYSLARGHGFAIGAITLVHLLALEQQCSRLHPNQEAPSKTIPMLAGIRNIDGHQCQVATVEVLADI
ncbi:POP1-domain-containing protein [Pholiota conissans]|uniref:POP1-domain-containing protein n=1 Tax=Pholiota conissans TaxID=109636 RepID=A0A9P6CR06_9AGAR|nr:POP1-domain-containing protein [Pholiota conissans]